MPPQDVVLAEVFYLGSLLVVVAQVAAVTQAAQVVRVAHSLIRHRRIRRVQDTRPNPFPHLGEAERPHHRRAIRNLHTAAARAQDRLAADLEAGSNTYCVILWRRLKFGAIRSIKMPTIAYQRDRWLIFS